MRTTIARPTRRYLHHRAPRPFSQLARRRYRLGLPVHPYRRFISNFPYRQARRKPADGLFRFHGLSAGLPAWPDQIKPLAPADWPRLTTAQICDGNCQCHRCGTIALQGDMWMDDAGYLCQECWERECARTWWEMLSGKSQITPIKPAHLVRARYAHVPYDSDTARRLRESRMRPRSIHNRQICLFFGQRPRPRTKHRQSPGTLHYLACRRYTAAQCQRRGFQRIRPGLWYDGAGDVVYIQTDRIEATSYVARGA